MQGSATKRSRIGPILQEAGLVSDMQLALIEQHQKKTGLRFASAAYDLGLVSEENLLNVLSRLRGCASFPLEDWFDSDSVTHSYPIETLETLGVMPVRTFRRSIVFAAMDPTDERTVNTLGRLSQLRVQCVLGLQILIKKHLEQRHTATPAHALSTPSPIVAPELVTAPVPDPALSASSQDAIRPSAGLIERQSRFVEMLRRSILALKSHDYQAVIEHASDALRMNALDHRAYFALARGQMGTGELAPAIESLEKTVALAPTQGQAWRLLALCFEEAGRLEDAETSWRQAVELGVNRPT